MDDKEYAKQIATTILSQLGGKQFVMMTGVKLTYGSNEIEQPYLCCSLPDDLEITNNIDEVFITYNLGNDLYIMNFFNSNLVENKLVKQIKDVYAEDLIPFFEQETGLYCYL